MAKSKVAQVLEVIEAAGHSDPGDGLARYHAAKAIVKACRFNSKLDVLGRARLAAQGYNVRVEAPDFRLIISTFDRSHSACLTWA